MWGVISFLVAVILFSFLGYTQPAGDKDIPIHGGHHWASTVILIMSAIIALMAGISIVVVRMLRSKNREATVFA